MRAQEIRPFIIATGEEVKWSEGPQWLFLHVHTVAARSGFHLPSPAHTAIILSAGTNPGLHLKNISAPCSVFWYGSMELFPGTVGSPQLTGGRKRCQTNDQNVVRKRALSKEYCILNTWKRVCSKQAGTHQSTTVVTHCQLSKGNVVGCIHSVDLAEKGSFH